MGVYEILTVKKNRVLQVSLETFFFNINNSISKLAGKFSENMDMPSLKARGKREGGGVHIGTFSNIDLLH